MTISIPAKALVSVGAFHQKEPRIPYDNDAPEGFQITVGTQSAWVTKEEAAGLAAYLTS